MDKEKNPRLEGEEDIVPLRFPNVSRIVCRDCKFKAEDRPGVSIKGPALGMCKKYFTKPAGVLWENKDCPSWEAEEDINDE